MVFKSRGVLLFDVLDRGVVLLAMSVAVGVRRSHDMRSSTDAVESSSSFFIVVVPSVFVCLCV